MKGRTELPVVKPEVIRVGKPETGFAIQMVESYKKSYTLPDGAKKEIQSKTEMLITTDEEATLDPTLFEVPPGFKRVKHINRNPPTNSSETKTA